jgi:hypothetical protein
LPPSGRLHGIHPLRGVVAAGSSLENFGPSHAIGARRVRF